MVIDSEELSQEKEQYSFSKLNSWWTCPYGYKLRYIDHQSGIGNAFASFGTLIHSIMERYCKGEIMLQDLVSVYEWEFETSVPEKFPYNKYVVLKDSYYKQGLDFLSSFQGYPSYQILGIEEHFELPIQDWTLVGFIDLVFMDQDGKLVIRDYKSKSSFKNEKEQREYARQLYLYSLYIKEKYGRYPDELQFLMFRKQEIVRIEFNEQDLHDALDWAISTVETIRSAFNYPATCDDFYGTNLCNHREYCKQKSKSKYRRKKS